MRPCVRASRLHLEPLEDRCLPSSTIIDLGPGFIATSVNKAGLVAGAANGHAALWRDGTLLDLGTLGGVTGRANDINDAGQVVGVAATPAGASHAFLLNPEDTDADGKADRWFRDDDQNGANDLMLDLGTLGGPTSEARGINNLGQVVGRADESTAMGSYRAFLWDSVDGMLNLGTFGVPTSTGWFRAGSEATAINDSGVVTGTVYSLTTNGGRLNGLQGFRWDAVSGGSLLGSSYGARKATGINEAGQIAGHSGRLYSHGTLAPVFYLANDAFLWQNDASTSLGFTNYYANPGDPGFDVSINKYAQVVGLNWLWQDGAKIDLNTLIDPAAGWSISRTSDITDAGVIVGQGSHEGQATSFLMVCDVAPPPVSISISDKTVTEGNNGALNVVFSVNLSRPAEDTITVDFTTADWSATSGTDYVALSGSVTFAPGEVSKPITIVVSGDTRDEYDEMFYVNLSNAVGAALRDAQGIGTILDNDPTPSISINDVSIVEGNSGVRYAQFTVTLSAPSDKFVEVYFATANGTATKSNNDYTGASGVVQFTGGQTTKTISVAIRGNTKKEADENFFVNLSNAYNATLADAQGMCTILNDD